MSWRRPAGPSGPAGRTRSTEPAQLAQVTASTADEAAAAEAAGAFAVECELIPARVMAEINRRTSMATISLGSGSAADVLFLFSSDICGESPRIPRHARVYGNVAALQAQIARERVRALSDFRADVASGGFPSESEVGHIADDDLRQFVESLDDA